MSTREVDERDEAAAVEREYAMAIEFASTMTQLYSLRRDVLYVASAMAKSDDVGIQLLAARLWDLARPTGAP